MSKNVGREPVQKAFRDTAMEGDAEMGTEKEIGSESGHVLGSGHMHSMEQLDSGSGMRST